MKLRRLMTLLLSFSYVGLVACNSSKTFNVKTTKLQEPFQTIKEEYYQQFFYDKGITTFGYEDEEQTIKRPLTINSFYVYRLYGVFDGAYMVDFIINNYGWCGWFMLGSFEVNNETFYSFSQNEPIIWKDHVVYSMQEAVDKNVITMDDLRSYSLADVKSIETLQQEYIYNLPSFDGKKNDNFEVINRINEDRNYSRIKTDYYNQYFVNNNITTDHEFCEYYEARKVNENSIALYRYYGQFDGAYLVSMMVNGHHNRYNYYSFNKIEHDDESVYFVDTNEPIVWKDGHIYTLINALSNNVISYDNVMSLLGYSNQITGELIETWSPEYASKLP